MYAHKYKILLSNYMFQVIEAGTLLMKDFIILCIAKDASI